MNNRKLVQTVSRFLPSIILLHAFLFTLPSFAAEKDVIFYLDSQNTPVTKLERVGLKSEGLYAILAMYSLQSGAGCQGNYSLGLKCELTRALGLGEQCSEKHLKLVSSWFKDEIPVMSIYQKPNTQRTLKPGDLKSICYNAPYYASMQSIWETIRIKRENNVVFVDAIRNWTSQSGGDDLSHRMRYKTKYRINKDSINVIEHKEIPLSGK